MDSERTLLLSPPFSSITASTFLPGSTSRGSRSRTRMATSMDNFYTFILLSLALVILILSPSASANRCIPTFSLLSNGDGLENGQFDEVLTHVTVREHASYKLNCSLSKYNTVKWTINSREVTTQLQDEWDIDIQQTQEMDDTLYTELRVNNASQKHHAGEYKCTPVCMSLTSNANTNNNGVTVSINIAINVTISVDGSQSRMVMVGEGSNNIYRINIQREKSVDIKCKAPVPNAQMTWVRIKDGNREENMADVCVGHDVELEHTSSKKKTQPHCSITHSVSGEQSSITLSIKRARQEDNEALKTISDFRKYVCKAVKEGNDGRATAELVETIQAERKFLRGERSVSVIEGNELEIYCDIHGVDKKEFEAGEARLEWHKDGQKIQVEELKNVKKIAKIGPDDMGKPYRSGFSYDMAEPEHRGQYTCELIRGIIAPDADSSNSTKVSFFYYVRIKDKLGALWPFLGICAEVIVLCTIILIYEKRRNKAELDESDTDGSPDQ